MSETILVLDDLTVVREKKLLNQFPEDNFLFRTQKTVTATDIQQATIIWGNLAPEKLSPDLNHLKWVQLCSAGYELYSPEGVLPTTTTLTNARGTYGLTVAEHTLATTMMMMRKLNLYYQNQLAGTWQKEGQIKSIYGSKVGILGLGDLGQNIAERFSALGSEIIGFYKNDTKDFPFVSEVRSVENLTAKLADIDVFILCVPASESNYHLINRELLKEMKAEAILVNMARGTVVDLDALCNHLEETPSFSAILDVTEPEPLPDGHRAWRLPNILITPHVAGGFELPATIDFYIELAQTNLIRFKNEQPLKNVVIEGA